MKKYSKTTIYLPIILALILVSGIFIGSRINHNITPSKFMIYPRADKLSNVIDYIEEEYVDTVDRKKITEEAINAILKTLDPHSMYIPASDFQRVNEPLEGGFSGIGVQFNMQDDTVAIINTIANGPSEMVGILPGDRIVKVNDSVVAGIKMASEDIVSKLKGPVGTKVLVSILRRGQDELIDFEIIRDRIPLYSVDVSYMISDDIGYLKISSFSRTTFNEFISAIEKLKGKGMQKLILDLRGNGGGYMDAATNIADQFLGDKKLIVYTEGKSRSRNNIYAHSNGLCLEDDVIILIDEWSASASEILAGAIQDNDRGTIVGRRSFGKGLVQEQIMLSDGSALRLTVARYHTPTGRSIQKPYHNGTDQYNHELITRFEHGEFAEPDSIFFADSLVYQTPEGKIVYGGGGIMPDIFIPLDTVGITTYLNNLRNRGLIYRFAFDYTDKHREKLAKFNNYKELDDYLGNIALLPQLVSFGEKNGVKSVPEEIRKSEKIIVTQLHAYIARNIFDNEGFYPIISRIDRALLTSKELFENANGE